MNTRTYCFLAVLGFGSGFLFDQPTSLPSLADPVLRLGSFNIQVLGQSKISKPEVVDALVKILSRYDIVQVLEIRDSTETVFETLRQKLNAYVSSHMGSSATYQKVVSQRLGRTTSKEQYGFFYRPSRVTLTDTYQYHDPHDAFEREPFTVRFHSPSTTIQDFAMMANHIRPDAAAEEMDNLTAVYTAVQRHWHLNDVLIGGDFNADCNYLRLSDWNQISLRGDSRFGWLISDNVDTTVGTTSCSYDRWVVAGSSLEAAVVPHSARAYRFDEVMQLNKSFALDISDHYPIEMELKGKPNIQTQQHLKTSISFTVVDASPVANVNDIRNIYRNQSCAGPSFTTKVQMEDSHMDFVTANCSTSDVNYIITKLNSFRTSCSGTISPELLSMADGYLQSEFLTHAPPDVYGLVYATRKAMYDILIKCYLQPPYTCQLTISKQLSG